MTPPSVPSQSPVSLFVMKVYPIEVFIRGRQNVVVYEVVDRKGLTSGPRGRPPGLSDLLP